MAAQLQLAIQHHRQGQLDLAEPVYRQILHIQPEQPDALHFLGVIHHQRGEHVAAVGLITRAIAANPNVAGYHANLGVALLRLGETGQALVSLDRAIALNPSLADAHYNKGNALRKMGQHQSALASYRQACAVQPSFFAAVLELAGLYVETKNFAHAIAAYRQAIALRPDHAAAHANLGAALLLAGDIDGAISACRQALALEPERLDALYNLGGALLKAGDHAGAIAAFDATLQRQPDHATARHLRDALAGVTTARPPAQYVANLFDGYADRFDSHLTTALNYRMPEILARLLAEITPLPAKVWRVLDLGCGTGLAGAALAPLAREIVGVDLSAGMLAHAAARKLYARLIEGDLLAMLSEENGRNEPRYDVIVAADVLVYLGDLQTLIAETHRRLRRGGYFLFSVESLDALQPVGDEAFRLNGSGRYAHARAYLEKLAAVHGFTVRTCKSMPVRTEAGQPIMAWAIIWQADIAPELTAR